MGKDASQVEQHLRKHVEGVLVAWTDEKLAEIHDAVRIRKIYRLEAPKKGGSVVLGKEAEMYVIGSMALKGS